MHMTLSSVHDKKKIWRDLQAQFSRLWCLRFIRGWVLFSSHRPVVVVFGSRCSLHVNELQFHTFVHFKYEWMLMTKALYSYRYALSTASRRPDSLFFFSVPFCTQANPIAIKHGPTKTNKKKAAAHNCVLFSDSWAIQMFLVSWKVI